MITYAIFGAFGCLGALVAKALATANKSQLQGGIFAAVWFGLLALVAAATPAPAKEIAYLVDGDMGGMMADYQAKAETIGRTKIIIDGFCASSCTLFLRDDWNLDVCYTDAALLGFHKPFDWDEKGQVVTGISAITLSDSAWKTWFFDHMPAGIRAKLKGQQIPEPSAGDPVGRLFYIKARDLHGTVKRCERNWSSKYDLINVEDVR